MKKVIQKFDVEVKPPYSSLRSLYISKKFIDDGIVVSGVVKVLVNESDDFEVEGTLNGQNGILSGMSALYDELDLKEGDKLTCEVKGKRTLILTTESKRRKKKRSDYSPVYKQKALNLIHIPPFRPENLNDWKPETEVDIYMAFGSLQKYTTFRYCCGASTSLLKQLGYKSSSATPDAILIDATTREVLIAEFKKYSSDFKQNHKPKDVDVVVVWEDNEVDRKCLPHHVLCLKDIAKNAAFDEINQKTEDE